ncbi:hypothetical protein GKZ90_0008900 [Flavobacterium sp. MC2016-06]|uniref:hypothetical protein n=1 Tax=Flavobacterium sp. MC2016-06 TaxID=2676308 RepID=UPI0012BA7786|nr:hypothetical protein [Flavobacterium sp. MC2016-06]MBU3859419.1 hypothetical protein [Flavobacterium sp. MC2016-06]
MKTISNKNFEETQSIDLTILSFVISTVLFVLYIVSNESSSILVIAWPFAASILFLNAVMLIHLVDRFIKLTEQRKNIGIKILILLSNIPITILYYAIVMKL